MIKDVVHCLVIRDRYGQWGFPKGHLEHGESSEQAALREVNEETGLTNLELSLPLGVTDWSFRAKGGVVHKSGAFYLMYSEEGDPMPELEEGLTECVWAQRVLTGPGFGPKIDAQLRPTLETDDSS